MRVATMWRKPLFESCKSSPRRSFISKAQQTPSPSPSPSPLVCHACRQSILRSKTQRAPQSRFQRTKTTSASDGATPSPRAPPQNHYEFFPLTLPNGPPPAGPFHIDLRALRKEFLQLQAIAHPDRHPSSQKARAEGTSARINEAYKTLQSPLLRAQYCLSLQGIDMVEDETAKTQDTELLMQVMEIREEIEDATEEGELEDLKKENDDRISRSVRRIEEAFKKGEIEGVRGEAVRLRYWVNVKESLDGWERGKEVVLNH